MCTYTLKEAYVGVRYDFQPQNILTAFFSISVYLIFRNLNADYFPVPLKRIAEQSANIFYLHGVVVNVVVVVMNRLMIQYKYPIAFLIVSTVFVIILCYYIGIFIDKCVETIMRPKERCG